MRPLSFSLAVCLLAAGARAADPPPSLQTSVRHAVAAHEVRDSDLKGSAEVGEPFRVTTREGGVLVGLEVGLGRAGSTDRVLAVRPLYRLGAMEWPGPAAGDFLAPDVARTVRSVARPGYAVGGMWVNAGGDLAGLAFVYHRVKGAWLDPNDRYESGWLGAGSDTAELLDGKGRPIVGLFGRTEGGSLRALGLTFADLSAPARPAVPDAPPRPKSDLEMENEALRAARAGQPDSGGLGWYVGAGAVTLVAGLGLAGYWAWRRRGRRRPAAAEPALKAVSPLGPAQWLPIRPRAGGLLVPGEEAESDRDDPLAPPSIPAPPLRPPSSGTFDRLWR
jgi:hypothetical protein